jgi:hypothetical protein
MTENQLIWTCARTAQLVQQWAVGWMVSVIFPTGARDLSLFHSIQTGSGIHSASYSMGTGCPLPERKVARAWSWPLNSI